MSENQGAAKRETPITAGGHIIILKVDGDFPLTYHANNHLFHSYDSDNHVLWTDGFCDTDSGG